jgi:predicted phage tail protein
MMRAIHLHGKLGETFGPSFRFDVATAGEGLRALYCAFPNFASELKHGEYRVVRGDPESGLDIELQRINDFRLGKADLHIIPVAAGAKNSGGTIKTIVGVALVGAAIFMSGGSLAAPLAGMGTEAFAVLGASVTWGNIALIGAGLALAGASSLLSKAQKSETGQDTKSFTLNGPVNVSEQGAAIPLIYGQVICGSQTISSGMDVEDVAVNATPQDLAAQAQLKAKMTAGK